MSTTTATASIIEQPVVAPHSSAVDDAAYMSFSGLLEGDLYDDELNEISTLFAPAVSDDEMSDKASSSPVPSVDYDENHPGTQVAVAAAAIDSALQAVDPVKIVTTVVPTPVVPNPVLPAAVVPTPVLSNSASATTTNNKRTLDQAMPEAPVTQLKRRITLSSSCGSLTGLSVKAAALVAAPVSPTSVAAAPIVPSSPTLAPAPVASAPKIPSVTPSEPTATTTITTTTTPATTTTTTTTAKKTTKKVKTSTITIRQGMTPEEKAKACRERNREHARKTRLRKKAYVDELKRSLNEVVEERDAAKALEEQKARILEQNRDVRFQVMQDFVNLRGNNEQSPQRWAAILVPEEFQLKLPVTDYQTMVAAKPELNALPGQQVLASVPDVMADAGFFSAFLQSLGNSSDDETASPIFFSYNCDRDTFLMDGCQAMFDFHGTSCGAVHQGAPSELVMSGTFRATFCPDTNRLRAAQIMFDTGSIRFQLEHMKQQAAVVKSEPASN
ncbi:expressed unknown protein [Seminavis robusta]|uniref:BZIP domain-containing protein n=1 Tax=Seminavis robusta TaxID=568900 RepID=A0A9N8H8H6_9STRA|nr:expressed unknown protein [Seminavis robusta]|eukprot:Sro160_g072260.1 n/a (500) ;mRNA; r:76627-78244